MNERQVDKNAAKRLAIIRHAREVTGNVALICRYYGISRQVFNVWYRRYEAGAWPGCATDPRGRRTARTRPCGGSREDHLPAAEPPLRPGERGCDVAAAGVPGQVDVPQPEVVELHSHAACLLRHVLRRCARGLAAPRKADPDHVMVAGERPGHRAPRGARSPRSVNEQQRRRLPRTVAGQVHPVRVLSAVITHARTLRGCRLSVMDKCQRQARPTPKSASSTVPAPVGRSCLQETPDPAGVKDALTVLPHQRTMSGKCGHA